MEAVYSRVISGRWDNVTPPGVVPHCRMVFDGPTEVPLRGACARPATTDDAIANRQASETARFCVTRVHR